MEPTQATSRGLTLAEEPHSQKMAKMAFVDVTSRGRPLSQKRTPFSGNSENFPLQRKVQNFSYLTKILKDYVSSSKKFKFGDRELGDGFRGQTNHVQQKSGERKTLFAEHEPLS